MPHFKTREFEFHSGRGVGLIISDILSSAKRRIWVCSPWISEKYANCLLEKKKQGVDVRLITTNDYNINSAALKKIMAPKEEITPPPKFLKYAAYALMAISIPLFIGEVTTMGQHYFF